MDVSHQRQTRAVKPCYQCCRLEEQIWKLAYEQVCPQIRRPVSPSRPHVTRAQTQHRVVREGVA